MYISFFKLDCSFTVKILAIKNIDLAFGMKCFKMFYSLEDSSHKKHYNAYDLFLFCEVSFRIKKLWTFLPHIWQPPNSSYRL